jgi:hypothetical protein
MAMLGWLKKTIQAQSKNVSGPYAVHPTLDKLSHMEMTKEEEEDPPLNTLVLLEHICSAPL